MNTEKTNKNENAEEVFIIASNIVVCGFFV